VLQCVAVCCSVLQCVAVCCSVLQCVAVCCSVLQCRYVCNCQELIHMSVCMMLCASVRYSVTVVYTYIYIQICRNICTYIYIQHAHLFSDGQDVLGRCFSVYIVKCCNVLQCAEALRTHATMVSSR